MPARLVNIDRQTPMFLPCDLREWVPPDHIVHFILDAVEQIPTAHFHLNERGTGSEQYPPTMMLALLIYCYATGRFGSRTIEAATHSDVAVRYLCANHHPDHDSICAFRVANKVAFQAAFVSVLQLARHLRLTRVGTVSVDGTKIQANASKHAAVSSQRAGELIQQLEREVKELMARAEQAEAKESQQTLDIPAELARRDKRVAALKQAYNAQAAVDEALLIVGERVSVAANDKQELAPTVAAISPGVAEEVKTVLVDSGFYSEAAVQAVEEKPEGTPTGVTVYAAVEKLSHHKTVAALLAPPEPAAPAPEATAKEKMAHRLKTAVGKALYRLRKQTVEPVFGIIKEVMGFRRFTLRGRQKVSLEWTLVCVSYNLKRMFTLKNLVPAS